MSILAARFRLAYLLGLLCSACASGRTLVYVAPSSQTIQFGTELTSSGEGQHIYVVNTSTVPITVTGLRLTNCENIKNRCDDTMRLRVQVGPGQRHNLVIVRPEISQRASSFRFTYSWEPAAAPTPGRRDSLVTQVMRIRSDSVVDSSLAVALRQARERSYQAATQVDTIVVHPDTLKLRVGQSAEPFSSLTIEARTTDGKRVEHFAPLFEVGDRTIAEFAGPGIQGRKVGLTWLVISAFTGDEADRRIFASTIVWILVKP